MVLMQTGSIDYPTGMGISDAELDRVEAAGERLLDETRRDNLRDIANSWVERRAMVRPEFAPVRKIFDALIQYASSECRALFLAEVSRLGALNENTCPAEAYVFDAILTEFGITFLATWREAIEGGRTNLFTIADQLGVIRSRLQAAYGGRRGGSRDHDLGWVIARLATIYAAAGGVVSASSHIRPQARYDQPLWIESTRYTRFCGTFVALLPNPPGVHRPDIGRLVHRALPALPEAGGPRN
jgi:hypothetical protein